MVSGFIHSLSYCCSCFRCQRASVLFHQASIGLNLIAFVRSVLASVIIVKDESGSKDALGKALVEIGKAAGEKKGIQMNSCRRDPPVHLQLLIIELRNSIGQAIGSKELTA